MKKVLVAVVGVALVAGGILAYRSGWIGGGRSTAQPAGSGSSTAPAGATPAGGAAATGAAGTATPPSSAAADAATSGQPGSPSATSTQPADSNSGPPDSGAGQLPDGNLALLDAGAEIAFVTSQHDAGTWAAARLIDGETTRAWCSRTLVFPQDIVVSFFARQPALVGSVVVNPGSSEGKETVGQGRRDLDVDGQPDRRVHEGGLGDAPRRDGGSADSVSEPVEARYVKLRILSNNGSKAYVECGTFKIIEARRAGYVSLLERHPDLAALLSGKAVAAMPRRLSRQRPSPCRRALGRRVRRAANRRPRSSRRRRRKAGRCWSSPSDPRSYPPTGTRRRTRSARSTTRSTAASSSSGWGRTTARTVMLLCRRRDSTRWCSPKSATSRRAVSDEFKKALVPWVADGHKLIIQDSDRCGGSGDLPDYSFLPFPFATSNPGSDGRGRQVAGLRRGEPRSATGSPARRGTSTSTAG